LRTVFWAGQYGHFVDKRTISSKYNSKYILYRDGFLGLFSGLDKMVTMSDEELSTLCKERNIPFMLLLACELNWAILKVLTSFSYDLTLSYLKPFATIYLKFAV
jgi:hypothetical protein